MELDELQRKVREESAVIKGAKVFSQKDYQDSKRSGGCLMTPFFSFIEIFAARGLKKEKAKRSHDIYELEADELLKNSELRKDICSALTLITRGEILTEENFLNYVAAILYETKIRAKYLIPLEPAVFAYIAEKISENGIDNFCREFDKT